MSYVNMTKRAQLVRESFDKGYRVIESGEVIAPSGRSKLLWEAPSGHLFYSHRPSVALFGYRTSRKVPVHKLLAYQLFGEDAFAEGISVRHLDDIPRHNFPDNIALGDYSDNAMDQAAEVRRSRAMHAASHLRKFTDEQESQIRHESLNGIPYSKLVEKWGCSKSTISYIVRKRVD